MAPTTPTARPALPLLLLVLALAGGLLAVLLQSRGGEERDGRGAAPPPAGKAADPRPDPAPPALARAAVDGSEPVAAEAADAGAARRTFPATGIAVDVDGLPVAGVPLACAADGRDPESREPRGATARDGAFALALPRAITHVVSADPGWTVVAGGEFRHDGPPLRLIVAPSTTWSGWIVGAAGGAPVPAARVRAVLPAGRALDALPRPPAVEVAAGEDGRFELAEVAALPATRIEVLAEGFRPYVAEPGAGATDLGLIALEAGRPPAARGVARLADGRPASGAVVRVGAASARADDDGAFELFVNPPAPEAALIAALPPHAPQRVPDVGTHLLAGDVDGLELVLGATGNSIEGRVVGPAGVPLKRWTIEVLAEDGDEAPVGPPQRTRKDGVFRFEGLGRGPFTVVARGRDPGEIALALAVEAPRAGLELYPAGAPRELAGRVLRADGSPAEGARVSFDAGGAYRASPRTTETDAQGRFALRDVPGSAGWLCAEPARRDDGLPARLAIGPATGGEIQLQLGPHQPVRFESEDPLTAPDALFAVGPDGRLRAARIGGAEQAVVRLDAGRSDVFALPRDARVLVLVRFGRELARVAVPPAGDGPVAVVRW